MSRVCIVQPVMKNYRVPFFQLLQRQLAADGIDLVVQYGRPSRREALRGDNVALPPPLGHESAVWPWPGARLVWQPALRPWRGADLVVVEHANKHLHNHLLALLRHRAFGRFAYWGHGLDRQADPQAAGERWKRRSLHQADWWFAYTAGAADYLAAQGFAPGRITTVQNAVDTRALRDALAAWTPERRVAARVARGWGRDDRVAVYCGSLYPNKRLDWLVDAGRRLHEAVPGFRLLVLGGGPQAGWMSEQAATHAGWLRYEGPAFGDAKVEGLALADLWLNPGLVGLGILDAFVAGLPFFTTDLPLHSPEIEYLQPGVNGAVSAPGAAAFAAEVQAALADAPKLARWSAAAREAGRQYGVETMAANFAAGVRACLGR